MPGVEKDTDVDEDMNTDYFKYTLHVHNTNFLYQTFLQPHFASRLWIQYYNNTYKYRCVGYD